MKKRFSISEAAKMANTTSGTLRHYDHIGLVSPHEKDQWTGYRYYSEQEIILLQTVQALQLMGLSLKEIKEILGYDDLEKIVARLRQAEESADDKIINLQYAKSRIERARSHYEQKLNSARQSDAVFTQRIPKRMILLSDSMSSPTVDNLWNYHSHFYNQIEEAQKAEFTFEDFAGIYTRAGNSRLFTLCTRYPDTKKLTAVPEGLYLCANCSAENREDTLVRLIREAKEQYGATPEFTVQLIVLSGILQWDYQIQIPLKPDEM